MDTLENHSPTQSAGTGCRTSASTGMARRALRRLALLVAALCALAAVPVFAQNTILVSKVFGATSINPGGSTSMTITLDNMDAAGAQTNVAFTDVFPAGLTWTSVTSNSCGGSLTPATGPAASLALSGGTIAAATGGGPSSCQVVVQVTASTTGGKTNTLVAGSVTGLVNGNPTQNATAAAASLLVNATLPSVIGKSFAPSTMSVSGVSMMTLSISNPNAFTLTNVALSDNFSTDVVRSPAGAGSLRIAAGANSNTCGGALVATPGSALVSLTGATIPPGAGCAISVPVEATNNGSYLNTIPAGRLTSDQGAAATNAAVSAALAVQNGLQVSKSSGLGADMSTVTVGTVGRATISISNPFASTAENISFTDSFPDQNGNGTVDYRLTLSPAFQLSGCSLGSGGSVAALPGGAGVVATGLSIPSGSTCVLTIDGVIANDLVVGSANRISVGAVTGALTDGTPVANTNEATWTHTITGLAGNGFNLQQEKYAVDANGTYIRGNTLGIRAVSIDPGGTALMAVIIRNPNGFSATGGRFNDTFSVSTWGGAPSDMVLATPLDVQFRYCGEAATASHYTPANGFTSTPVPPSITPLAGGNGFTLNDLSVIQSSGVGQSNEGLACTVLFRVTAAVAGTHTNAIYDGSGSGFVALNAPPAVTGAGSTRVIPGGSPSANIAVRGPLSVSKSFSPDSIATDVGISRLTIVLTNKSTQEITNLSVIDFLPAWSDGTRVRIAPLPNASSTCGGTITATAGAISLNLTNGVLPASVSGVDGLCTVAVDVVSSSGGTGILQHEWLVSNGRPNIISTNQVSGRLNGDAVSNADHAVAELRAFPLAITATKNFYPGTIEGGGTADLTITVSAPPGTGPLVGVSVTDNLPAGMVVADPLTSSTTCTGTGGVPATITASPLGGSISMTGANIPFGGSCTVTVKVSALQIGTVVNTLQAGDARSTNGAVSADAFSANLVVQPRLGVEKRFVPARIPVGGSSELEVRIFNATGASATNVSLIDNMPAQIRVASPFTAVHPVAGTTCPGLTVNALAGSSTLSANGLTLPPASECRFRVRVTSDVVSTAPHWVNNILQTDVSSQEGGIYTANATAALEVYAAPVVAKSFSTATINLAQTSVLALRVTNPAVTGAPMTNVTLVDNLPAGIVVAATPNLVTSGACATGSVSGATAGSTSVGWVGGTLSNGEYCEIQIAVRGLAVGTYTNTLPACDTSALPPVAGTSAAAVATSAGSTVCNIEGATAPIQVVNNPPTIVLRKVTTGGVGGPFDFTLTNTAQGGAAVSTAAVGAPVQVDADSGSPGTQAFSVTTTNAAVTITESTIPAGWALQSATCANTGGTVVGSLSGTIYTIPAADVVSGDVLTCDFVNRAPAPAIQVTKSSAITTDAGTIGILDAGDVITYTVLVTNTGNVPLSNLVVADVLNGGTPTALTCPATTLTTAAPGNTVTCNAYTHTVTQAEVDAGAPLVNVATATARDPANTVVTDDDTRTLNVLASAPSFTLDKRAVSGFPYANVGDVIHYEYEVRNTGNVTLGNLVVADDRIPAGAACPMTTLAPAAGTICTASYTVTAADIISGSVTNIATATVTPPTGTVPPVTDTVTVTSVSSPDLVVSKTHAPIEFTAGHAGSITLNVGNLRNVATSGIVTVTDTLPAGLTVAANGFTGVNPMWSCSGQGTAVATCTTTTVIPANTPLTGSPFNITFGVNVAVGLNGTVVNNVTVGGGSELAVFVTPGDRGTNMPGNTDADPILIKLPGSLGGRVWFDKGSATREFDGSDTTLQGWVVTAYDMSGSAPRQVGVATTGADGTYTIEDLVADQPYKIVFRDPQTGVAWSVPEPSCTAGGTQAGLRLWPQERGAIEATVAAGVRTDCANLPVDPSGVVYDSAGRNVIANAIVTLSPVGVCTGFDPALHIVNAGLGGYTVSGSSISMPTNVLGLYQFFFTPDAPASCQFSLSIDPASIPNHKFVSTFIPPSSAFTANAGVGTHLIQPQASAPSGADPTTYHLLLTVGSGTWGIVHNHIPVDPANGFGLVIAKVGSTSVVEVGDSLKYTIRIRNNNGPAILPGVQVDDVLPAGFRYIPGTARLNNATLADPSGSPGPALTFAIGNVPVNVDYELTYRVRVGVGSQQGDGINRAQARSGPVTSNVSKFKVKVTGGVFTDEACLLGKVYVDTNANRLQDIEELGVPGVRLYLIDGTNFITDVEGKYSFCGLPPRSNVIKVDPSTLPRGAELVPSSNRNLGDGNSLWLDIKRGELHRGDFIIGNPTDSVLNQVKARRSQGEVSAPQTEKKAGQPALVFESRKEPPLTPATPKQGVNNTADQPVPEPRHEVRQ